MTAIAALDGVADRAVFGHLTLILLADLSVLRAVGTGLSVVTADRVLGAVAAFTGRVAAAVRTAGCVAEFCLASVVAAVTDGQISVVACLSRIQG
jgi:hypothetical protein